MDANKILSADFLDILFEGKNKEYGAYDLRKTYNRRLVKAIVCMTAVLVMLLAGYLISHAKGSGPAKTATVADVNLEDVKVEKKEEPVVIPPKIEPVKVEMAKFTPPKIVKDNEVKEDEKPPEQEKLDDTKIGNVNQEGVKDEGITAPPTDEGKGGVEGPKKEE